MEWIEINTNKAHISKEKEKAKKLRQTNWWRSLIAKGECYYCKKKFPPDKLTMDHIVPLSRGGKSVKGNIVPACKECNSRKKYFTPAELIMQKLKK